MPIQAPQWTDYLNCPVCCREFGAPPRSPVSLGCGHTLCSHCLKHLHKKQCPFDQTVIQVELEELVVNTALLQLAGYPPPTQPYQPPSIKALPEADRRAYDVIVQSSEQLAVYLKFCANSQNASLANNNLPSSRLSRPMQRKLVTLLQCAITDEEGRGRAARAARSLGERTVTELILQHQNPQQLSANLWAAVRARGCQFLGPAMQEEVLKLVLLALEDGSALSRKVLVMFVVQRLEPHFPQASKTSIGHVVQLLYRASCFKVSKRECDSSLMQLKDEFRTYESLRREHDAQIVQIATEAGLRVAPDQWSALLYGDTAHKSHMQSIIDKLQTPQSFGQSVQELFIALQRTGDPAQLVIMSVHLDRLANIDPNPDAKSPTWQQLAEIVMSLKEVISGLVQYLQLQAACRDSNYNQRYSMHDRTLEPSNCQPSPQTVSTTPTHTKYKVLMCRDAATRSYCPRGITCTFAHSEEELERYRNAQVPYMTNDDMAYVNMMPPPPGMEPVPAMMPPQHMYPIYAPPQQHAENNFTQPIGPPQPIPLSSEVPLHHVNGLSPSYPVAPMQRSALPGDPNGIPVALVPGGRFWHHSYVYREEATTSGRYTHAHPMYPQRAWAPMQPVRGVYHEPPNNVYMPAGPPPFHSDDAPECACVYCEAPPTYNWQNNNTNVYDMDRMRHGLPQPAAPLARNFEGESQAPTMPAHMFTVPGDRPAVGPDRLAEFVDRIAAAGVFDSRNGSDGYQNPQRLVEKLEALERGLTPERE